MICPNCGRELPDNSRVCSGCGAAQRIYRRKRAEADIAPESAVHVARRVAPEKGTVRKEQTDHKGTVSTPNHVHVEKREQWTPSGSKTSSKPVHHPQNSNVRHVRHAPNNTRRKVDASPAMMYPPIYQKSHKRLIRALIVILLVTLFVASAGGYMLFKTESGQQMMAQWGWSIARTDAYVTLGKQLLDQAYFTRALDTLQIAIDREPENVDALILMGQAYTELGRLKEATDIYESLIGSIAPAHPSAYRNLIKIYQDQGYNAEALQLMKIAAQNTTGTNEFDVMLREYTPVAPVFSKIGGRYPEEIDVTISTPEGQTVYYTTDGTDPSETGLIYKAGTKIHIPEGKMTIKAIGFTKDGTPSEQITHNYTVIIPTPSAPKANRQSGKYKYAPKVSLRPGEEDKNASKIVAIYYTLDGRQATTESTLYNPDEPIQLPTGKTTLRAIAVAENGKISYEMTSTYEVEGNLKRMFSYEDTFKNLTLYKTGYNAFTKSWGKPETYDLLPKEEWYDEGMESYEAVYEWGSARFVVKKEGSAPVLYALDTTNPKMTGPRGTKIGMNEKELLEKFRDLGQAPLDEAGNRLLYNWNSENKQFGTYRVAEDGSTSVHYYDNVDEKNTIFVELTYDLDEEGNISRIFWQRYLSELTQ